MLTETTAAQDTNKIKKRNKNNNEQQNCECAFLLFFFLLRCFRRRRRLFVVVTLDAECVCVYCRSLCYYMCRFSVFIRAAAVAVTSTCLAV